MDTAPTLATDLREMMQSWDRIVAAVAQAFPQASAEARYQIASETMRATLGLR